MALGKSGRLCKSYGFVVVPFFSFFFCGSGDLFSVFVICFSHCLGFVVRFRLFFVWIFRGCYITNYTGPKNLIKYCGFVRVLEWF